VAKILVTQNIWGGVSSFAYWQLKKLRTKTQEAENTDARMLARKYVRTHENNL